MPLICLIFLFKLVLIWWLRRRLRGSLLTTRWPTHAAHDRRVGSVKASHYCPNHPLRRGRHSSGREDITILVSCCTLHRGVCRPSAVPGLWSDLCEIARGLASSPCGVVLLDTTLPRFRQLIESCNRPTTHPRLTAIGPLRSLRSPRRPQPRLPELTLCTNSAHNAQAAYPLASEYRESVPRSRTVTPVPSSPVPPRHGGDGGQCNATACSAQRASVSAVRMCASSALVGTRRHVGRT